MKKYILALCLVALATAVCAEVGMITLNSISKQTVSNASPMAFPRYANGIMNLTSNASSCSVFINATTLTKTQSATGFPLVQNTTYTMNVPSRSHITFTCLSSAGNRAVYIVR